MSTKEKSPPPPPPPKLVKLNKAFKLAEQWVNDMTGDAEEETTAELEVECRPYRLGLGAKALRNAPVGLSNDPVERKLHRKLGIGKKKTGADEGSTPSAKNEERDDSDDDEKLDSRTNAFGNKRAAPLTTTPQAKKKPRSLVIISHF